MFELNDLHCVCELIRQAAQDELMSRFRQVEAHDKADGSLITEADLAMQERLATELAQQWPQIHLLGEEMTAGEQQALLHDSAAGLWCLDPLDGTSNYASSIPFFAVSLGLSVAGKQVAGVVYDPVRDECFSALKGQGAWLNDQPLKPEHHPETLQASMAMVDLKRLPTQLVTAFAQTSPYRSQRSYGSVALDWCWLAAGRMQIYLHGGQKLWDYAAGSLILQEAGASGGLLETYDGDWEQSLTLDPRIALAATDPALLGLWRGWIRKALNQQ